MRTLFDVLAQMSQEIETYTDTEKDRQILKDITQLGKMFYGYSGDKCKSSFLKNQIEKNIDRQFDIYVAYRAPAFDNSFYEYYMVKYFLSSSEEKRQELINSREFLHSIVHASQMFTKFIEPKYWRQMFAQIESKYNDLWSTIDIWHFLMTIDDFDNVPDDFVKIVASSRSVNCHCSYSIAAWLFGEDRLINVISSIEDEEEFKKNFSNYNTTSGITMTLLRKLLKALPDKFIPHVDMYNKFNGREFLNFCEQDHRYLSMLPGFERREPNGFANGAWENSSYSELMRYAAIISKCCNDQNLPSYQAVKLKSFAALLKIYNWNFSLILQAILPSFDANGKLTESALASFKSDKSSKTDKTFYVIVQNGILSMFNTEEARDNVAAKDQSILCYNFNAKQLKAKMEELGM